MIRIVFLFQYISDQAMRQQITACTNVVEGFNPFTHSLFFGKDGIITENDPEEQENRLKYLDVSSAVILQNTVDISWVVPALSAEGYPVDREALAVLSPYMTKHLKRFGDYVLDLQNIP